MKVLVSTREQQGGLPAGSSWTVPGELVTPVAAECCSPSTCGCGRGLPGLASSKATTTAMIVEMPGLDPAGLRDVLRNALDRQGWLRYCDADEAEEMIAEHVEAITEVCAAFPVGTVVGRWHDDVFRRSVGVAA